uniref:Uncharacterized protein n=1 Tax=Rhizophora mucronata TaxID=61149 RepID=A0A2P2Q2M4_RHIMU
MEEKFSFVVVSLFSSHFLLNLVLV